jgi:hypothetical protein
MNRAENAAYISRATAKKRGESLTRHGDAKRGQLTPEYRIWAAMRQRCTNPTDAGYANYGGRGITVTPRWWAFENFLADMGRRPSPAYSLDRIDNERGYGPDNCRWATRVEQKANQRYRRDAVWIEHGGETKTLDEWAKATGIRYGTLHMRLRHGWTIERALTTPTRTYPK